MKENKEILALKKNYQNNTFKCIYWFQSYLNIIDIQQDYFEQTNQDFEQIILKNIIFTLMMIVDFIVITDQALNLDINLHYNKRLIQRRNRQQPILIAQDGIQSFTVNCQTLIEQGTWNDVILLCDLGIRKFQNNINIYQNKATALREKGQLKQALDILDVRECKKFIWNTRKAIKTLLVAAVNCPKFTNSSSILKMI